MPVYFTGFFCSTQYVAHFIWVTESLKIGEYVTICSTQYILPKMGKLQNYLKSRIVADTISKEYSSRLQYRVVNVAEL